MATRSFITGALAFAVALAVAGQARAEGQLRPSDRIKELPQKKPKELEGVELIEKTGERAVLDLEFRDERGARVNLKEYFADGLPVILTLNYSDCPMLCSLQLGALVSALSEVPHAEGVANLVAGRQFHIVTVSLDPKESPKRARQTKDGYVQRFQEKYQDSVRRGWHFLTGDEKNIRALADSVGFHYRYLAREGDYLHPTSIMLLANDGMIIQYIKGIDYGPEVVVDGIVAAGTSNPQASVGFLYSCFHYDSKADSYADFGRQLMTYVGSAFAFLLLAGLGVWHLSRTRKSRDEV